MTARNKKPRFPRDQIREEMVAAVENLHQQRDDLKEHGQIPPHDPAAERGAIGCVLGAASERDADAMLAPLRVGLFYDLRHQRILEAMQSLRLAHRAVDLVTVTSSIGGNAAKVGGIVYLQEILDTVPSVANFPAYLETLEHQAEARSALQHAASLSAMVREGKGPDELRAAMKELAGILGAPSRSERPTLLLTDPKAHLSYKPRADLCLVGDHDITKGYEGVAVIGGPPGSGKSLVASSLALAGAMGATEWMGRKVHRRFKTLMIQAENGALRLRREFEAMAAAAPKVDLSQWIRVSLPPEGGLPFHRTEFRRAFKAAVEEFKPDVVILDPWTAVAADDAAKDVVDKLAEIRSCLPPGDECPALLIVAHTRKPKAEGMRRGRGLLNELSGSLALGATARSVYVLLPFTDEIRDDRVLWSCAKLSNGEPAGDSVWHRRVGGLFPRAVDDAAEFWERDEPKERVAVSKDELRAAYGERVAMSREDLVSALVEAEACSYQTARRITGPAGYLVTREWVTTTPGGLLALAR
jgi:hypothetical protein